MAAQCLDVLFAFYTKDEIYLKVGFEAKIKGIGQLALMSLLTD
jgi:hypothetical protein